MTFFTSSLKGRGFTGLQYGILFGIPYALTAVLMVLNSRHSDKTRERRGHVALVYLLSGISLILSVGLREHFWVSYALMCLAIPGPFAAMGPFWSIPSETLPRSAVGLVIGVGQCLRQSGRVCRTLHRRLAQAGIPEPGGCLRCAGRGIADWRRAGFSAPEGVRLAAAASWLDRASAMILTERMSRARSLPAMASAR